MISIIIPALNEEELLPGLLGQLDDSVRIRHDAEVILSDGGSTDRTLEIALRADCILVKNTCGTRQTIAQGRNAGAAVATGKLLVFLNADIRLSDPGLFFDSVHRVMNDERVVGATSRVHVFPEIETRMDRAFHAVHNVYVGLLNRIGEGMGRGECQVVRAELFRALGGYNQSLAAGEDYELFRRVRRRGRIRFLPGITVYESPRRFRKYGYARIVRDWTLNATSVILRKRSSSSEWESVR